MFLSSIKEIWLFLKPGPGPWPWKTWTLKNLDQKNLNPEKPEPWKTGTLKNLDQEKRGKHMEVEKWLEEHNIIY